MLLMGEWRQMSMDSCEDSFHFLALMSSGLTSDLILTPLLILQKSALQHPSTSISSKPVPQGSTPSLLHPPTTTATKRAAAFSFRVEPQTT